MQAVDGTDDGGHEHASTGDHDLGTNNMAMPATIPISINTVLARTNPTNRLLPVTVANMACISIIVSLLVPNHGT